MSSVFLPTLPSSDLPVDHCDTTMSELSLDRLFQRIIESEQTEESRREQIALLKTQINDARTELKSISDSCSSSKGRLHILVRQYHNEKAECLVLNAQKESLRQQKAEMSQDIENLKSECARNNEIIFEKQSQYSRIVREFCADFDLTGEGAKKRREATLAELNQIHEEVEIENEKYANLLREDEKLTEAMEQRVCLQAEISQLQAQIIDADSQLETKKQEAREAAIKVTCHGFLILFLCALATTT